MRKIYTIGETVLDVLFKNNQPITAKAGGACLNSAVTMGRLGLPVHFISEYGTDKVGNLIDDFLKENNISTDFVYRYGDGKTSLALAFLNENSDADYEFYKVYPRQRLEVDFPDLQTDDIVLFGSFYAITAEIRPKLMSFIHKAKSRNAIVIYDPNFRAQHRHDLPILKPYIEENISLASIIRGSHEDFEYIFSTGNADESYEALNDKHKKLLYTSSDKAVFLRTDKISATFPVKKTHIISTIGAGDNFNAGLVYSIYKNRITYKDIGELDSEIWSRIIETAVDFATHVCTSYDNYISIDFAQRYTMK
jgi:fructokinase